MTDIKKTKTKYFYALGRRKTAVATVRLFEGKGESTINNKPVKSVYKSGENLKVLYTPLDLLNKHEDYHFTAVVKGGGSNGQIGALVHALSRSLVKADAENKTPLKQAKLLTRDSRMVERKHTGFRKARKSEQYSKR